MKFGRLGLGLNRPLPWYMRGAVEGVLPSLILDYENNRYAANQSSVTFSNLFTFSRASTATYVDLNREINSLAINAPQMDYSTGSRGLLIEDARTNLVDYSVYGGSYGSQNNTITANSALAPDNTVSAVKFTRTSTAAAFRGKILTKASAVSTPGAFSIFAKKGNTGRYFAMRIQGTYPYRADAGFDLETGTVYGVSYNGSGFADASAKIEELSNGWYRCSIMAGGSDASTARIAHISFNSQPTVQVDATDVLSNTDGYIWGWQFEENTFRTSYIPTTGSTVTRARSYASIDGDNFSDFYNQNEGTFVIEFERDSVIGTGIYPHLLCISDGTINNAINIYITGTTNQCVVQAVTGGVSQGYLTSGDFHLEKKNTIAVSYTSSSYTVSMNGMAAGTLTGKSVPATLSELEILNRVDGTYQFSGVAYNVMYYPAALEDASLRQISSEATEYITDGDSYVAGASGIGIYPSLKTTYNYKVVNTAVGGSTLEEATLRVESNFLAGNKYLIFCDGSVNSHGTIAEDIARYQRIYDACGGRCVLVSPVLYSGLAGTSDGQYTLDLTAEMISTFGTDIVVDGTAIARTLSGAVFTDATDADDAGYASVAYDALFQADNVHPGQTLADAWASAAVALIE